MSVQPQHDPQLVKLITEALTRYSSGDKSGALIAYKRVQRQFPDFADSWINASGILFEMGRAEEALDMALRAVELAPENAAACCALANSYQGLGRLDDAVVNFRKAIAYDPAHIPALTNLAGVYARAGNFTEALALDDRAIQAQPDHSVLWGNRGHTKMRALDIIGAELDLKRALELDSDNALARWNLAYVQLLQHRYREAWPNFKARRYLAEWFDNRQDFGKPHWDGEPLDGRTLLVYTEQGFGDTLHFVRFIPRLKQFGGKVLLLTYEPLKRLLSELCGINGLAVEGEPLPYFDLVVPLMELPVILNLDSSDLEPLPPPALPKCPPIPELNRPGFKIGLVWAGSQAHTSDALRSMNPGFLDELADIPGIAWYGLQKPPSDAPPKLPGYIDMSRYMGDFMDTAQIVKQLDLIVTVDTSMAHLAGFLGQPAIVMLAYLPDWRWGLDEHTPWYPNMTLLRQPVHGDWRGAINILRQRITEFGENYLRSLIEREPEHPLALTNLAGICVYRGNLTEALEFHDRAVKAQPTLSILWARRGNTKILMLDMVGAEADLTQALKLDANNEKAQSDLVHVMLRQNRYQEAWPYFKARQSLIALSVSRMGFGKPCWQGEHLNGRTLLVYSERGFGDTIQFARFLPQVKQRYGGRVLLSVFEPLRRLLAELPGIDGLIIQDGAMPDFDLVVPITELPPILSIDASKLPPPIQIVLDHRSIPELDQTGFKVGLIWAGSPAHANDARRSINPRLLDELADIPGMAWYGLQIPPSADPPKLPAFIDMSPYMGDFMDTAQIARQLDLIVTVDTSMAHLAGSLGIPTIVLLTFLPEWRWGLGEHTPWYPSVTLLKQPSPNDWKGAVNLLKQRITELATPKKTNVTSAADNPQVDPALVKLFRDALARQSQGDRNGAVIAYKRIQRQFPDFADAWINAAALLSGMDRAEEALDMALHAVELVPENPMAIYVLGFVHLKLRHFDEAEKCLRSAIEREPKHALALNNLADVYEHRRNFKGALKLRDRAIEAKPSFSLLWERRGNTKMFMLDMSGAEADLLQTLKLSPGNNFARLALRYVLQLQGRYREGWVHLNAILNLSVKTIAGKPYWNGKPLNGGTLLVYSNGHEFGGYGDVIQFSRFLQQIKQICGGRVILYIYWSLKRLMTNVPGIDEIMGADEPLPDFDAVLPFSDLPSILNIDISELPPPTQILPKEPPPPLPELNRPGFKVGLVWAGSHQNSNKAVRDIAPTLFDKLSDIQGIAWYGLQKPSPLELPKLLGFIDMSPYMDDFMDTAQIVRQLDLIVTVDTSMAHLAGSLGIPTIVLLALLPDWRWGLNSSQTPWYETVTLLRQKALGDWLELIGTLKQRITKLVISKKATDNSQADPALVKLFKDALTRQSQGDRNGAVIAYKRIQRQFPEFADAWINASMLLCEMNRAGEALDMALRAVELAPESPMAIYALGFTRLNLGYFDEAEKCLRSAIEREPKHALALNNLADVYEHRGNLAEALELRDRAVEALPSFPLLWARRGNTKMLMLDMVGAEADLTQTLKMDANNAIARSNLHYIQLLQHRYREAWSHFNSGHLGMDLFVSHRHDLGKPHWNGEPLNGRTLLLYAHQHGFGDTIQFARFFKQIQRQYGGRLLLLTYEPLKRLLTNAPGLDGLVIEGESLPDFDLVLPVMLLPLLLNADPSDFPPPIQIIVEHRPMTELDRPGFKVGLVWAGSPVHPKNVDRSMSPRALDDLADIPGIVWYGLQKPPSVEPPKLPAFIDMSPYMGDFMDTAQIARQLDLIVTVDTSMAHLAGSLGIPTIVLLAFLPEWRWGLGEHTPWYPSVTLLKQPSPNDWKGAVNLLKQRLTELAMPKKTNVTGAADNSQADPALVKLFKDALARQSQGDRNGAVIAYKRIQRQFPDFADAWINASTLLCEMERAEEALDMALRAVELAPESPMAIYALGFTHLCLGHIDEADNCLRSAIERDPKHALALNNLADIYVNRGDLAGALKLRDRAVEALPSFSLLWARRGNTKMLMLDMVGAEADLAQTLKMDANNVYARSNLQYIQQLQHRYREAWSHLRSGHLSMDFFTSHRYDLGKPHWNGEPLDGRTLLVYAQRHGFGNTIQFARFFQQIQRQYGGRVLLLTYEPLKRLLTNAPGLDGLVIDGESLPNFDLIVPEASLLVILNADPSDFPPPIQITVEHRSMPELDRSGFKVGLVWGGSPGHERDAKRSINPRLLDDLADIPGIVWYGLQKPPSAEPPKLPAFIDMSPYMGDFMDTAQIARQLDLIVTVDTAMAHLAGSLNLPTIVMLEYLPDWRWGLGEHTPWYQTLTLLRQPAQGDWMGAINMLKQRITELAMSKNRRY